MEKRKTRSFKNKNKRRTAKKGGIGQLFIARKVGTALYNKYKERQAKNKAQPITNTNQGPINTTLQNPPPK
jgi:hypothetical protein